MNEWNFNLRRQIVFEVDSGVLLVEDEGVAVVARPEGREGLQVTSQLLAGLDVTTLSKKFTIKSIRKKQYYYQY